MDKFVANAFKATIVVYVLVLVFRDEFRADVYRMVSVPLEYCLGITLVYIGGRWVQTRLGISPDGLGKPNPRALRRILGAVAGLAILCVGIEYVFHNFSLAEHAMEGLQASSEGRNTLGIPMREGWFITGEVRIKGGSGAADLSIPVRGSRAAGELEVRGIRKDGVWLIADLYLIADGNNAVVQIPH